MFSRLAALALTLTVVGTANASEPLIAKISVLASGQLLLNGKPSDFKSLDSALSDLKTKKGEVWYYRENAQSEPHPNAMAAVQLVVKHQLPVSMSSKSDFSDYIDRDGRSKPRRP
jgi:biopolymer transport protein ExbD